MPRCVASRRAALRQAATTPRRAMPMSCRSTLFSRSRPRPSSRLRSQQWKCIDRRMAERASGPVFPHSLPLSLSRPPARLPAVSFPVSPLIPASFPSILSSSFLRYIFFSSETHFPRLAAACSLSLSFSFSLFLYDIALDALVLVATLVHVDYHPSCRLSPLVVPRTEARENIYADVSFRGSYRLAEFRVRSVFLLPTVNRTCHRLYE